MLQINEFNDDDDDDNDDDSLPRTPINHRVKFDAASFSSAEKCVTVQTHKITTTKASKQTVNDI